MKKMKMAFLALATLALLATGCGGGGGGGSDGDDTPALESGSSGGSVSTPASESGSSGGSVSTPAVTVSGAVSGSSVFIAGRSVEIWARWCCDHEVTQAEYQSVMGSNPSYFSSSLQAGRPRRTGLWRM